MMNSQQYILGMALFLWSSLSVAQVTDVDESKTSLKSSATTSNSPGQPDVTSNQNEQVGVTLPQNSPPNDNRTMARKAYNRGWKLVQDEDLPNACIHFEKALGYIRLPIILYAAAQCRKDLGHDIEALLLFSDALKANSTAAETDRIGDIEAEAIFNNIKNLLRRFVQIEIVTPDGDNIRSMKLNNEEWTTTRISANPVKTGPGEEIEIDYVVGLTKKRLANFQGSSVSSVSTNRNFWIKPDEYDFDFVLQSGRTMFLKNHSVEARRNKIDLGEKTWPTRVIIEEVPAGTTVVFQDPTHRTIPYEKPYTDRERDVEIPSLGPGTFDLIATRKGYLDFKKAITLDVGQRQPVYLDFKQKPIYKKWPFWLGVGLATAAIVAIAVPLILTNQDEPAPPNSGTVYLGILPR